MLEGLFKLYSYVALKVSLRRHIGNTNETNETRNQYLTFHFSNMSKVNQFVLLLAFVCVVYTSEATQAKW